MLERFLDEDKVFKGREFRYYLNEDEFGPQRQTLLVTAGDAEEDAGSSGSGRGFSTGEKVQ